MKMSRRLLAIMLSAMMMFGMLPSATGVAVAEITGYQEVEPSTDTPIDPDTPVTGDVDPTASPTAEATPTTQATENEPEETSASTEEPEATETPVVTEAPTAEPTAVVTAKPEIVPPSITVSITPMVATVGDKVTLSATVSGGPVGMVYQWQWARMGESAALKAIDAGAEKDSKSGTLTEAQASDGLIWNDEPGATSLTYTFTATEDTQNRYWRLNVWVPEPEAEAGTTGLSLLHDIFFATAFAADGQNFYSQNIISTVTEDTDETTGDKKPSISVTAANADLTEGESTSLTAVVIPADAVTAENFAWNVTDGADVVETANAASGTCDVLAIAAGKATIEYSLTVDGDPYTDSVQIVVKAKEPENAKEKEAEQPKDWSVSISVPDGNFFVNDPITLRAKGLPDDATVEWSAMANGSSVALGNATENPLTVTLEEAGTYTFSVTAVSGDVTKTDSTPEMTVAVPEMDLFQRTRESVDVTTYSAPTIDPTSLTMVRGEKKTVKATVASGVVTYKSSDRSVATVNVSTGEVTAVAKGNANITVFVDNVDTEVSCAVTVVGIDQPNQKINIGQVLNLTANVTDVRWTSDAIGTVIELGETNGMLTGRMPGSAIVNLKYPAENDAIAGNVTIQVAEPAVSGESKISFGGAGETYELLGVTEASGVEVEWSAENIKVLEVSGTGVSATVKGMASGSTKLIAKVSFGGDVVYTATMLVAVAQPTLTPATVSKKIGEAFDLTVNGIDASTEVQWDVGAGGVVTTDGGSGSTMTFTAAKSGTATITATIGETKLTAKVTVAAVAVSPKASNVALNGTVKLTLANLGEDADVAAAAKSGGAYLEITPEPNNVWAVKGVGLGQDTIEFSVNGEVVAEATVTVTKVLVTSIAVVAPKTSIRYDGPDKTSETLSLKVTVLPSNASDQEVTWTSSNTNVATVEADGVVTPKGKGSTVIKATANDGSKKYGSVTITVTQGTTGVAITGGKPGEAIALTAGKTHRLGATVTPSTANNRAVKWEVSDSSVASVSTAGVVTAKTTVLDPTEVTVTVTTADGSEEKDTQDFKIYPAPTRVTMYMNGDMVSGTVGVKINGGDQTFHAIVSPDGKVNPNVKWTSSNKAIAYFDETGAVSEPVTLHVVATRAGSTKITAITEDGTRTVSITLNVAVLVEDITITGPGEVAAGKSIKLTGTATAGDGVAPTNKNLTWTSANPNIAKVTASGTTVTVTGVAQGETIITAKAADGSGITQEHTVIVKPVVSSIKIKHDGQIVTAIAVDSSAEIKTLPLEAVVEPSSAAQTVNWTTSNSKVAAVDQNGNVSYNQNGTATITATATDGSSVKGTVKITVSSLVKVITINGKDEVGVGKTTTLTTSFEPAAPTSKKVTWTSSNPAIATVSTSGVVTGKSVGEVTITATAADGSGTEATHSIKVTPLATRVIIRNEADEMISKVALELNPTGDEKGDAKVHAEVLPFTPGNPDISASQNVTWKTSNARVATVIDGFIQGIGKGTATITATAADGSGKAASITVTVGVSVKDLSVLFNGHEVANSDGYTETVDVAAGKTAKFTVSAMPTTATNRNVTWSSSDTTVATVSTAGVVTAKNVQKDSSTTITATAADGSGKTASFTVNIKPVATKVIIYEGTSELPVTKISMDYSEKTRQLRAEVQPDDATNDVTWKTSNARVATVSEDGTVTAMGTIGTANITATAADGSGKSAVVAVTVSKLVQEISVTTVDGKTSDGVYDPVAEVALGKTLKLVAKINPSDATKKTVTWSSADAGIATVSTAGVVTGRSVGVVDIIATVTDGSLGDDGNPLANTFRVRVTPIPTRVAIINRDTGDFISSAYLELNDPQNPGEIDLTSINLDAVVYPEELSNDVTWKSSNTRVAVVDSTGHVEPVAKGTATISATTKDGSAKVGSISLTVGARAQSITITGSSIVASGKSIQLAANVLPANTTNKAVTWSVSRDGEPTQYATISTSGLLTAKTVNGAVTVAVMAVAKDGSGVSETHYVTILPASSRIFFKYKGNPVKSIALDVANLGTTYDVTAVINPAGAGGEVTWKSSNASVLEVVNTKSSSEDVDGATYNTSIATVRPLKAGTATLTATATDGTRVAGNITVTVSVLSKSVSITGPTEMLVGQRIALGATVLPAATSNKTVLWSGDPDGAATVNQLSGIVTAVKAGEAYITAKASDGASKTEQPHKITVYAKPTALELDKNEAKIEVGDSDSVFAQTSNTNGQQTRNTVTVRSSNTTVARVTADKNGVIKIQGVKAGDAVITVTSADNTGLTAKIKVKVQ